MRSVLTVTPIAALMLASAAYAQRPAAEQACHARDWPPADYLESLARQYHPEALAPAVEHDSVVIAFVFDSTCQLARHATGHWRASDSPVVDSMVTKLFPDLGTGRFTSTGAVTRPGAGHPIIVWALLRRS